MVHAAEVESALRAALPKAPYQHIQLLAQLLADAARDDTSPELFQQRLAAEPALSPLLAELAGQTLQLGATSFSFIGAPLGKRAVGAPLDGVMPVRVLSGDDQPQHIDLRRGVAISSGFVEGVVVGFNQGTINYTKVTVEVHHGTRLDPGARPAIVRTPPPQPPLPALRFYDRQQQLSELQTALLPRHGAWLTGQSGCGMTTLLKHAANTPAARAFADGIPYLDGATSPSDYGDVVQSIYSCFFKAADGATIRPDLYTARTELGNLDALYLLDQPRLEHDQLVALAGSLAGRGAVLVSSDGSAPDALLDIALGGLPQQDALTLLAREAGIDAAPAETAALLGRLCAALDYLPLPLLLAARIIRMRATTLGQLTVVAEGLRGEREPLARAVRLALMSLAGQERAVLSALVRAGGSSAAPDMLAAASGVSEDASEDALARMLALRLVNVQDGRYSVYSASMRRVLARLLPRGQERQRAAAFLAGAAALHVGDMVWLEREWANLLAAARESLLEGNVARAGALARAVQPYLVLKGLWGTWGKLIDVAEQAAGPDLSPTLGPGAGLRAWALHERGTRAGLLGELGAAATYLTEARRLRLALGDHAGAEATTHNMNYLGLLPPTMPAAANTAARRLVSGWRVPILIAVGLMVLLGAAVVALWLPPGAPTAYLAVSSTTGSYPLEVRFDASRSSSPDQNAMLVYIWDFGDGAVLTDTERVVTHTYALVGNYTATLRVRDQRGALSGAFAVPIVVVNASPRPWIELPGAATRFAAGQPLTLGGGADDTEDGSLPDAVLEWTVVLHQGAGTTTLLGPARGNGLAFSTPAPTDLDLAPTSYVEVRLRATDSLGATSLITRELRPELVSISFVTEPAGLGLTLNGRPIAAPRTVETWRGTALTIGAPEQPDPAGGSMLIERWSDGGAPTHMITATATATYTAIFKPLAIEFIRTDFSADESDRRTTITVALNPPSNRPVAIRFATSDGTARAGQDYAPTAGTLDFAPGQTSASFDVPVTDDALDELDETVELRLSSPDGRSSLLGAATLTLHDNDPPPIVRFDAAAPTVNEAAGAKSIAVVLNTPSGQPVAVNYTTSDGTARAGQEYVVSAGTLAFAPGETSKTFSIPIIDDALNEANKTLGMRLSGSTNAAVGKPDAATLTIQDDDPLPSVSIEPAAPEAKESDGSVQIMVSLSTISGQAVTVRYTTSNETAAAQSDYVAASDTLTFQPGEKQKSFGLRVLDDLFDEDDETLKITLSDQQKATPGASEATLKILDDDDPPSVFFNADRYQVNESAGSTTIAVQLSAPSGKQIEVDYVTSDGAATSNSDYTPTSDRLVFLPGQSSRTFKIPIIPDGDDEPDETLALRLLNAVNATLDRSAVGLTIIDDDMPKLRFITAKYSIGEGPSVSARGALITVALSGPSWQTITVEYAMSDGTATDGRDYRSRRDTLTFQPRQTTQSFIVPIVDDPVDELDETVKLSLSHPTHAEIGLASATLTIVDGDPPPQVSFQTTALSQNEKLRLIVVTVVLDQASEQNVMVDYATGGGTATPGKDYVPVRSTLIFRPRQTTQSFTITLIYDSSKEPNETVGLTLSNPKNARLGAAKATLTIIDFYAEP